MNATKKHKPVTVEPFKYADFRQTPNGYECGCCGKSGVKLWREYNTFLDYQTLYCVVCGYGGKEPGSDEIYRSLGWKPITATQWGDSDQTTHPNKGSLVPAVPSEDGSTYWGYTSVPAMGCLWWRSLSQPDWTDEKVLSDYEENVDVLNMFKGNLHKLPQNERDGERGSYWNGLIKPTEAAIAALRGELALRMKAVKP